MQLGRELRISELRTQIATIEEALKTDAANWNAWKKRKREYEKELASIVSYFVDHNVITTDDD